jgi:hypothetical protein
MAGVGYPVANSGRESAFRDLRFLIWNREWRRGWPLFPGASSYRSQPEGFFVNYLRVALGDPLLGADGLEGCGAATALFPVSSLTVTTWLQPRTAFNTA